MGLRATLLVFLFIYTASAAIPPPPGALISTSYAGTVGVLLDEIPTENGFRDRVAQYYLSQENEFWTNKTFMQARFTNFRQVFRSGFYPDKKQLTLPPYEVWQYTFDTAGPRRTTIGGHDYVAYDYTFYSVLVADSTTIGNSEPALEPIGGSWSDTWLVPVDAELLFQRTNYACMNEFAFPKGSIDSENPWVYYDDSCEVEPPQVVYNASEERCHFTAYPNESCVDAVNAHIGAIELNITWTRLPWNDSIADAFRFGEQVSDGADMSVIGEGFHAGSRDNRIEYRYFPSNSCAFHEAAISGGGTGCVGAPGWRRLLKFSSSSINVGKTDIFIGVAPGSATDNSPWIQRHVFEWDPCHQHAHFEHYGTFFWGDTPGRKVGFCLQTTWRYYNNEYTKLDTPYDTCNYQGISVGWGDDYIAGLDCQWIDVTDSNPGTKNLGERFNPDGFLCEGFPIMNGTTGLPYFVATNYTSYNGETVYRGLCNYTADFLNNNSDDVPTTVPPTGSRVNYACKRGELTHLRDCGWTVQEDVLHCTPGQAVTVEVSIPSRAAPHGVRICEASSLLGSMPCVHANKLANILLTNNSKQVLSFTCPSARDNTEQGGLFSLLTAPILESDPLHRVTFKVLSGAPTPAPTPSPTPSPSPSCNSHKGGVETVINVNFAGMLEGLGR